jgi:hypothetical protein
MDPETPIGSPVKVISDEPEAQPWRDHEGIYTHCDILAGLPCKVFFPSGQTASFYFEELIVVESTD